MNLLATAALADDLFLPVGPAGDRFQTAVVAASADASIVAPDLISIAAVPLPALYSKSHSRPLLSLKKKRLDVRPRLKRCFRASTTTMFSNSAPRNGWVANCPGCSMPTR